MLVVLYAGLMIWFLWLYNEMNQGDNSLMRYLSQGRAFVIGLVSSAYFLVVESLLLGFMISAVVEGDRRQDPLVLLRAGRYYLWRWLRFQIGLGVVLLLIAEVCYAVIHATFPGTNVEKTDTIPGWVEATCLTVSLLVLMKVSILMPADMIVRNRMVIASAKAMREYSLERFKGLIGLYLIWQAGMILLSVLGHEPLHGGMRYAVWTGLAIWVSTWRFAAFLKGVLDVRDRIRPCGV